MSSGDRPMWERATSKAGKFLGKTTSQAIGIMLDVAALIALDQEDERRRRASAEEREIIKAHGDYSHCMAKIYSFRQKHTKDKYADVFLKSMADQDRPDDVSDVNECRSVTKDYWDRTQSWAEDYDDYLEEHPSKKARLISRYRRFQQLVDPIDKLPGYQDDDHVVSFLSEPEED